MQEPNYPSRLVLSVEHNNMATKQTKQLHTHTVDQLHTMLQEERAKLLELRMQKATSALKNVKEIYQIRKRIARILTILKLKTIN